ncbi:TetR family transcriptional regulator [Gibbsiella quercinecans]|uniref:TetR family transcriptional regulator n=1 Tax=Gibbsiella quercinecans TaxID=929813 RepID=A0A250B068_9GAMM|nr:TetR family transcriptional regulator [Gibbsiella quercinecans]ATA19589.1 TetR family transcriptional regulator [Gibbsiella quercinecans]RLM04289.1 TetR family transcriptional regulator [Gibbsiella quercinecans]RLM06491.1 TetR family transcriptional regulator [Gibbsiella quercinecans]TCT83283.1 TetR family transcriptional regulator [Gibbsiella quercinecans]
MAWDTEGTKRKILNAAVVQFAELGPDGATIELVAKTAGVNKERVYKYFGDKQSLFKTVLSEELAKVAQAVAIEALTVEDIGEYAGRAYDYHREHPELNRLLRWEGLVLNGKVPDEDVRRKFYIVKTQAIKDAQEAGIVTRDFDADHLAFLILGLAGWWAALPQVARMFAGTDDAREHARRRASVVLAAHRLALAP